MEIVVFSNTKTCQPCKELHAFLKNNNIKFTDYDFNPDDRMKELEAKKKNYAYRATHLPTIFIGNETIVGFDEQRLSELLNI